MLTVPPDLRIPLSELRITYARSSGPGGQNVNKVNSKATLRWPIVASPSLADDVRQRFLASYRRQVNDAGEVVIVSQRFRDAPRNAEDCLEKLGAMLAAVAVAPKTRRPSKPTRGSIRRRLENKRRQSQKKSSRRGGAGES